MAIDEFSLKHGHLANLDAGSVGVVYTEKGRDGGPPEVLVAVKDDGEHDFTLHPGDTFPVGSQTWKLDRVDAPGGRDWTVVFSRIA
jgi:hypothetical protein